MPGFNALAPGGRYVIYGAANWTPTGVDAIPFTLMSNPHPSSIGNSASPIDFGDSRRLHGVWCQEGSKKEIQHKCRSTVLISGDKPGWLKLAAQYLRRPRLDPLQMIGQNR